MVRITTTPDGSYASPVPGVLVVDAEAQVYTGVDEGDRYWFVLLRDPTTDAEVGRWIYDTQPYRPALRVTESPTFSDRIPVPPGTYKVTVGVVSSVPLVDPDGVPEGDPFANSILTTFYETVT